MHHGLAVEKRHDAGLDRRRSIVRQYDRRDDHVAAVVEHDRYRRLARPIASGERVSATATLHPGNRDRPAGAERRNLAADEIEVAHAIEVGVIGDAGRAIAGAELGAQIELDLAAAVGRLAGKRAARPPLIHGERPLRLHPARTGVRRVARPPWWRKERDGDRAGEPHRQRERQSRGLHHEDCLAAACGSARALRRDRARVRDLGPDRIGILRERGGGGVGTPGVTGCFSVLSSASAAALMALSASSYLPSAYRTQAVATCHWMSTCSAQYASLAARSFSRSSASLAISALAASGWPDRAAPKARAKCVMASTWASGVGLTASCAAAFQSPRSIA